MRFFESSVTGAPKVHGSPTTRMDRGEERQDRFV